MQEGPAIEDKWIHSVEKELRELEQENARLKTLLKEQGEKLIASIGKGECLNESEEKFRKLFEEHSAVMLVIDPDTANIVDANRAAASFYGWSIEQLRKMNIQQINLLSPDVVLKEMDKTRSLKQNRFVFCHRRSDGSVRDVEVFSNRIEIAGKAFLYSVIHDISERMQAEQELRLSEERFRKLFENHAAVMLVLDPDTGNIVDTNRASADFYGWSVEELKTMHIQQLNPVSVKEIRNNLEKSRSAKQNRFFFRHRCSDGSLRDVDVFTSTIEIAGKKFLYAIVFDITESKLAEKALCDSERKFRTITEQMVEVVFVTDTSGILTYVSQAIEIIFGYTPKEVIGDHFTQYLAEEEIPGAYVIFNKTLQDHLIDQLIEFRFRKKSGELFYGEVHVHYFQDQDSSGMIGLIRDVTERKQAEQELFQLNQTLEERIAERTRELEMMHQQVILNEKLASIGQLAAGIAHELNNPLNFIKINFATQKENFIDLLLLVNLYREITEKIELMGGFLVAEVQQLRRMEAELAIDMLLGDIPKIFSDSNSGIERMTTIINSMRSFSMSHAPDERVSFDVNKGIRDTLILARHEYRDVAEIETLLDEVLPGIYGNPEQISQLFLNLIVNSAHAIKSQHRSSQGKITIHTWFDSSHVFCSIADDGPGIPEEIRKNIFNPFFSTKEPGKGIGLGLSICYDIVVNKHRGTLSVECPAAGGTVITIGLPSRMSPVVGSQPG